MHCSIPIVLLDSHFLLSGIQLAGLQNSSLQNGGLQSNGLQNIGGLQGNSLAGIDYCFALLMLGILLVLNLCS